MSKRSYKDLILVLIYKSNGEWSWYQIERALDLRGIGGKVNSGAIIKKLIQEELIKEIKIPDTNLSRYSTTDQGEVKVRQLVDEFGSEAFAITRQNPSDYEL